jgi:hypothetical protein
VLADRACRLVRQKSLAIGTGIPIVDLKEDWEPQNLLYGLTKDNFDLWTILFPQFDPVTREITGSKWHIRIGCDSCDSVSHEFCQALARDLARYATMIDFRLDRLDTRIKAELNIAVLEEGLFKKLSAESYNKALEGRSEIGDSPIIMSWRDSEGKPHIKLGINNAISNQPRMKRLFYCMCGIFDCVGGVPKPQSGKIAAEFAGSLE